MRQIILALATITYIFSYPVYSAEKMKIAVMDLKGVGVSDKTAISISNMIRTDLINSDRFIVIERSQLNLILKEQGFQQTGCTDQDCAVQIGRLLSANKMLLGEIGSIGKEIIITIRIVDVEKGSSEYSAKEQVESEKNLGKGVSNIVGMLMDRIEKKEESSARTMSGYYIRGIVPGWGQFYSYNPVKGSIIIGAFVLSGAYAVYSIMDYNKKKDDYSKLGSGTAQDVFDKKYNAKTKAADMAWVGIGLFSAVYIINWIDILFFSKPDFTSMHGFGDNLKNRTGFNFSYAPEYPGNTKIDFYMTMKF